MIRLLTILATAAYVHVTDAIHERGEYERAAVTIAKLRAEVMQLRRELADAQRDLREAHEERLAGKTLANVMMREIIEYRGRS